MMTNIRAKLRLTQEINSATTIATLTRKFLNENIEALLFGVLIIINN
jgi:hypothetical protein